MNKQAANFMRKGIKVLILVLILSAHNASAQTDRAWNSYRSGDLETAERQAQIGYKQSKSNRDRAQARKIAAIIAYSLGKSSQSKSYFAEARRLDPSIRILESETLDPSIISFLDSPRINNNAQPRQKSGIKTSAKAKAMLPSLSGQNSKPISQNVKQSAPVRKSVAASAKPVSNKGGSNIPQRNSYGASQNQQAMQQKNRPTYLQVNSNVRNATLSLDGILAGNVGQLIEVSPGLVNFEVGAPGYKTVSKRISLAKGETKKVAINLQKNVQAQPYMAKKNIKQKSASLPLAKKPKAATNMFDDDALLSKPAPNTSIPAGNGMNYQPAPMPQTYPNGLSQGAPPGNIQSAPSSYGQFPGQSGSNSQVYNPGVFGGGPNPNYPGQGPNIQYQTGLPNGPGYSIPYGGQWPAQNQYYPAPFPNPYVPQSTVTIVPIYPSGGGGGGAMGYDPYGSHGYSAPPPSPYSNDQFGASQDPFAGTSKKKKKKKKKVKTNIVVSLLPLGIPQFSSGKPLLGTLFGGGQIAGLYLWYKNGNDAKTARTNAETELKSREEIAPTLPEAEQEAYYTDTDTYKAAMEKYIKNLENYQTYSLIGTGALWGISIIESIAFGSSTAAKFDLDDTSNIAEQKSNQIQWYLSPLPDRIILGAKWDF